MRKRKPKRYGYCSIVAEAARREAISWKESSNGNTCFVSFPTLDETKAFCEMFECYFLKGRKYFIAYVPMVIGTRYK